MPHRPDRAKKQAMADHANTFKHLPLNHIDSHSKRDFDRKSSSAEFEGNGSI
jgi:hypothetical protein